LFYREYNVYWKKNKKKIPVYINIEFCIYLIFKLYKYRVLCWFFHNFVLIKKKYRFFKINQIYMDIPFCIDIFQNRLLYWFFQQKAIHMYMDITIFLLIYEIIRIYIFVLIFNSPDPKGHVRYCHHLASVVRLYTFSKIFSSETTGPI
jgi:hypothetical protein